MKDIKWVIFDLGGIVVPESKDLIDNRIAEYLSISVSQFLEMQEEFMQQVTMGKITLLEVYSILVERLELSVSPDSILEKHLSAFREVSTRQDSDILHMIGALKDNYNVGCLTNTEIEIADINKTTGLFGYFQKVYLSTEIGLSKPNVAIYNYMLADIDCSPQEVIFIDDRSENVESALRIGINAIQFSTVKQLQDDLSHYCSFMS